jgi:hypothetical protein
MESKTNEILKQKLDAFEATPPDDFWDNIEKNIQTSDALLYNIEIPPPEDSWEIISAKINPSKSQQLKFGRTSNLQWLKYAALIIVILTISTTAFNPNMRNAFINSLNNANIKASLPEKPYQLPKNVLTSDSARPIKNFTNNPDSLSRGSK